MAVFYNGVAFVSIGTTEEDCDRLVAALQDIASREKLPALPRQPAVPLLPKTAMKPRDAWFAPAERVPLGEGRGKISAETIAVYPPGIPVLNPGEVITDEIYEYLLDMRRWGCPVRTSRSHLKTIKVVLE